MNRTITLFISVLLLAVSSGFSQTGAAPTVSVNEQVQSRVKQYSGSKKRVVVVTRFGEKFKGIITSHDDEKFILELSNSGQSDTFRYDGVKKVYKSGGLSAGSIAAIAGAGGAAAILLGLLSVRLRS